MTYKQEYNSVSELIEKVWLKPHAKNKKHRRAILLEKNKKGRMGWYSDKPATPHEMVDRIKNGDTYNLEKIRNLAGKINIENIKSLKRKRKKSDQGDDLNIESVYSGNLDRAWSSVGKSQGVAINGKEVTICVNVGGNCNRDASTLIHRGVLGLAMADAYATAGYAVSVYAYFAGENVTVTGHDLSVTLKLTEEGMPFDAEKLSSVLCSPGFFRTLFLATILAVPEKVTDGMGHVTYAPPAPIDGAINISGVWSEYDIQDYLKNQKIE